MLFAEIINRNNVMDFLRTFFVNADIDILYKTIVKHYYLNEDVIRFDFIYYFQLKFVYHYTYISDYINFNLFH